MSITPFDVAMFAIIVVSIVRVSITGFIAEFFSKAAVILGLIAAILFYRSASVYLQTLVGGDSLFSSVVAFLIIFLLVYLIVKILQHIAGNLFQGESLSNLDRAMGFFLGIAEGLILVVLLIIVLHMQSWFDESALVEGSLFVSLLTPFLPQSLDFISPDFLLRGSESSPRLF